MRYLPFVALVIVPLVLWPVPLVFVTVLLVGLRVAIALAGEEKPHELNAAIWHPDEAVRRQRLADAMDQWERRNRPWKFGKASQQLEGRS